MSNIDREVIRELAALRQEISDLRWRLANIIRPAPAVDVDNARGLVRGDLGSGLKTGWVQVFEHGGAVRSFSPTSEGEVLMMLAPYGDIRQSFALRGGFSGPNPKPDGPADEHGVHYGASKQFMRPDAAGLFSSRVDLGADDGPPVARVGDLVDVQIGSSKGLWPIVTGSQLVRAG